MKTSDFFWNSVFCTKKVQFKEPDNRPKNGHFQFQFDNSAGDIFIEKYPVWDGNNFVLIFNNFNNFWHKNTKKF